MLFRSDATKLAVCHNKRIPAHKTFKDIAQRGKTTTGWFFGFKLHLVINHKGEIMAFHLTAGNVDDRKPLLKLFKYLIAGCIINDIFLLSHQERDEHCIA